MTPLSSLQTPRDVAVWLSTNPTRAAVDHALDDLIATQGHDEGLRTWLTGIRIHDAVRGL